MVKGLAVGGCLLVLAACDSSIAVTPGSPTPSQSTAGTPAATLRVHLDLLLEEHVFTIAKLAIAASAGRGDEFRSYAGLLASGGGDVETLFRSAIGETAGAQFGDAWTEQNNYLVDYLVAASTHSDQAGADAMSKLTGAYVPHAATVLGSSLSLSSDAATQFAMGHVVALKAVVDDSVAGNYAQFFADIAMARVQAVSFGDAVAVQVARLFADRFPGDPITAASARRVNLNSLMQQQGYVMTIATDAAAAGVDAQTAAASAMLTTYAGQLAELFGGGVWKDEIPLVTGYAKTGDAAARQGAISAAPPSLAEAFTALLKVADDQRGKQFGSVATDDHAMATALANAADEATLSA